MGFLSSLFGNIQKAFQPFGQAIGGAVQSLGKTAGNIGQGLVGAAGQAGQQLGQNIGKQAGASIPKTAFAQPGAMPMMPGPMPTGGNMPTPPGFGNIGSVSQAGQNVLKRSIQGMQSPISAVGPAAPQNAAANAMPDFLTKMFGGTDPGKMALGAGINMLGNVMAPKTEMPDFNSLSSVQALKNFQPGKMSPELEASINRSLDVQQEQQNKQLRDVYKNVRPGTDYTTDSAYQRDAANLGTQQSHDRADAIASAGLSASSQELDALKDIATYDVGTIMYKLGLSAQEAEQFKQSFSNVGSMFLTKGLYPDSTSPNGSFDWTSLLKGAA